MRDTFLSGWGEAKGGRAYLSIRCDNEAQADAIRKAAEDRPEMVHVQLADKPRRIRAGDVRHDKHASEFSGHWLAFMPAAEKAGLLAKA
jgi:hypothetical protein